MKAWLCRAFGGPETLVWADAPEPTPGPGQIVVDVKAASLNFPDVLIIEGKYQHKPAFPFPPGSECVGTVSALGAGVDRFKVGDRVAAFTLWGSFAERVVVDSWRVVKLPGAIDWITGAAYLLVGGTALHALRDRGALKAGETLLVLGAAGGTGVAAIGIGRKLGAHVIAAASSAEKLALCRDLGADATIDYTRENLRERLRALTDGRGVDVVFDPVGGEHTEQALRSIAWRGRLLVVGFAAGPIPKVPANLALLRGASVIGANWGEFSRFEPESNWRDLDDLAAWIAAGELRLPVTETIGPDAIPDALRRMAGRRMMGKIVVDFDRART